VPVCVTSIKCCEALLQYHCCHFSGKTWNHRKVWEFVCMLQSYKLRLHSENPCAKDSSSLGACRHLGQDTSYTSSVAALMPLHDVIHKLQYQGCHFPRKIWNCGKVRELENGQGKSGISFKIKESREKSGSLCSCTTVQILTLTV